MVHDIAARDPLMNVFHALAFAGLALAVAGPASGQELRDFCPDRPGLGTPACTMDPGHVALEVGLLDWSLERGGGRADTVAAGDLLVRLGLTDSLEAQIGWTAFVHRRERNGRTVAKASGSGDVFLALRQNVSHPDGAGFAIALMPYATLPTGGATAGAGDWGAGLLVPVSYALAGGYSLGLTAEADAAVDGDGNGRHLAYGGVLGLDVPVADTVGATFEIAATRDRDPAGHSSQYLAGASAGWAPSADLQLDAGANVGLNRAAPDVELYFGVARRF